MSDITLVQGDNRLDVNLVPMVANIYGVVTNASTGNPLPDVKVSLGSSIVFTDSQGAYGFEAAPGSYTMKFEKVGFITFTQYMVVTTGDYPFDISLSPVEVPPVPPEIPEIILENESLAILDVEGIEFVSVGVETQQDWTAFGRCLHTSWTGFPSSMFTDGNALARCMEQKGAATGETLKQCLAEHPEWLTAFAKQTREPQTAYLDVGTFYQTYGKYPKVGMVILDTECYRNTVTGVTYNPSYGTFAVIRAEFLCPNWKAADWQPKVDYCAPALAPFEGPVATLAQPVVMSKMRGMSIGWMYKQGGGVSCRFNLEYKPTFDAPMPPPVFQAYGSPPQVGALVVANITSCYAGGYYYPGVYDGVISFMVQIGGAGSAYTPLGWFKVKNLAKVTGTGVVTA